MKRWRFRAAFTFRKPSLSIDRGTWCMASGVSCRTCRGSCPTWSGWISSRNGRLHWVASGPLGRPVEWDAEIINEVEGYLLAWQSLPGSDVDSAGSVRFRDLPGDSTELTVHLQYQPPAGKLGAWAAWLTGEEPTRQIHDDLRAVKRYLETGVELAAH